MMANPNQRPKTIGHPFDGWEAWRGRNIRSYHNWLFWAVATGENSSMKNFERWLRNAYIAGLLDGQRAPRSEVTKVEKPETTGKVKLADYAGEWKCIIEDDDEDR